MKIIKKKKEDLLRFRPIIQMGAIKPRPDELKAAIEDENYVAEVKYDGYRMLSWQGYNSSRFTTRSIAIETIRAGNPMPTERTDCIPHLINLKNGNLNGTILDGEIWKPNCRSHDITSMVGGLPETSLENQTRDGFVIYMMYDILQYRGNLVTDLPYFERRKLLINVYQELLLLNKDWKFKHPETEEILCNDLSNYLKVSEVVPHNKLEETFRKVVLDGGEGLILKHIDSKYHEGKIGKNGKGVPSKVKANKKKGIPFTPWIKYKKIDTVDCVIMGFSPATIDYTGNDINTWQYWLDEETNEKIMADAMPIEASLEALQYGYKPITKFHFYDWPGAIILGQYNKKNELIEIGQTSGITDEMRKEFANNPEKYIGKVCEVEVMEQLKNGALREPRFIQIRENDKNAFECRLP